MIKISICFGTQIQTNKQHMSSIKNNIDDDSKELLPPETTNRLSSRWNNEEFNLAITGFRMYGKKFSAIAGIIGSKSDAQVRTFFVNYRKKYNLDELINLYDAQQKVNEKKSADDNGVKQMESEIMMVGLRTFKRGT